MHTLVHEYIGTDGELYTTTDYVEATTGGNKRIGDFLIDRDPFPKKGWQLLADAVHRAKIREKLNLR